MSDSVYIVWDRLDEKCVQKFAEFREAIKTADSLNTKADWYMNKPRYIAKEEV